MIEFTNVGLYLAGIQTVFSVVCCSFVSVLSCWLIPAGVVSAVRTLAISVATAVLLMRHPIRVGRVHGVSLVFNALRPAVVVYLVSLVLEQLIHTCVPSEAGHTPSWRRVVFQGMMLAMFSSGIMRARNPLQDTDLPFLVTFCRLSYFKIKFITGPTIYIFINEHSIETIPVHISTNN